MSEAKMAGKVRRAITRSDEGEVRARVARALGCDVSMVNVWWGRDGSARSIAYRVDASRDRDLTDGERERSGVAIGANGWEIEVRRELPAPWRWWPFMVGGEFLARSDDNRKAIAFARSTGCDIYDSEDALVLRENIQCASLTEARERAEDECWSRGLFGVVEDAPPVAAVDPAQAVRNTLLAAFERATEIPDCDARTLVSNPAIPMLRSQFEAHMRSIGAVVTRATWRLSDGPPPGWEWRAPTIEDCEALVRVGRASGAAIACIDDTRGIEWDIYPTGGMLPAGPTTFAPSREAARDAALMACRRAGLFAPPVAAEPTDAPRDPAHEATVADLEAQIAGLVARLAICATERNASRPNETDAGHRIATMEKALARVTAERNEARLNVVDARKEVTWWKATVQLCEEERNETLANLAQVTAERDELTARKNHTERVRDTWKARAEDAEGTVIAMRALLATTGKATP